MNDSESGTTRLARVLFAIWMLVSIWLVLRAVVIETAIQSSLLSRYEQMNSGTDEGDQQADVAIERARDAPLSEIRLALTEAVALALGFYVASRLSRRFSTRPWGHRLAQVLVLVGAVAVAVSILGIGTPTRPMRRGEDPSTSMDRPTPRERTGPRERPNLAGFFPAPSRTFTLRRLEGQPFTLPLVRPGRFMVIDFWASWCAPCVKRLPTLRTLAPELARIAPIDFIMVSLDRSPIEAKRASEPAIESATYLFTEGNEWEHEIVKAFRITSVPHSVLVLPDGRNYPVDLNNQAGVEFVKAVLSDPGVRKQN